MWVFRCCIGNYCHGLKEVAAMMKLRVAVEILTSSSELPYLVLGVTSETPNEALSTLTA